MARLLVVAASAPLLLIGAAYPIDKPALHAEDEAGFVEEVPITYRPCRPGPGDDRCIQLYERGVRASYARWLRDHDAGGAPEQVAMGGPEVAGDRSAHRMHREHRAHRDDRAHREHRAHRDHHADRDTRCDGDDGGGEARGM